MICVAGRYDGSSVAVARAPSRSMTRMMSGLESAIASTEMSSPWWLSEPSSTSSDGVKSKISNIGPMVRPVPGVT